MSTRHVTDKVDQSDAVQSVDAKATSSTAPTERRLRILILLQSALIVLLFLINAGLFVRMEGLQNEILRALQPVQPPAALPPGTRAPSFTLPTIDGADISLSEYRGKPVLLFFASATCPGCVAVLPSVTEFQERHPDVGLLMISTGSSSELEMLRSQAHLTFPILLSTNDAREAYKVAGTPFFYVLDSGGFVISSGHASSTEQLEELYAELVP
jgi:peroxiredoxin